MKKSLLVVALILCFLPACKKEQTAAPVVAPIVEVVTAETKDVPISAEWVGTTDGQVNAVIRPKVNGYLVTQNYREGAVVKKGDLLFQIDDRPFQASLEQAKAKLDKAQAEYVAAQQNADRYAPLAKKGAISKKEYDDAFQRALATKAQVEDMKAVVEQATLDLNFTKIISPIDGVAGIAKAQVGDLVGQATSELTTVSTLDPIRVYFAVSEQDYMRAAMKKQNGGAGVDRNNVELILAGEVLYPKKGELILADRQVDPKTGSIKIAAEFPNPGNVLRPGQFARVRLIVDERKGAILLPQRSVTEMQGAFLVALVGQDNKVAIKPVKIGERVGDKIIVLDGISAGDRVVAEGLQKVKDGMVVNAKPFGEAASSQPAQAQP